MQTMFYFHLKALICCINNWIHWSINTLEICLLTFFTDHKWYMAHSWISLKKIDYYNLKSNAFWCSSHCPVDFTLTAGHRSWYLKQRSNTWDNSKAESVNDLQSTQKSKTKCQKFKWPIIMDSIWKKLQYLCAFIVFSKKLGYFN